MPNLNRVDPQKAHRRQVINFWLYLILAMVLGYHQFLVCGCDDRWLSSSSWVTTYLSFSPELGSTCLLKSCDVLTFATPLKRGFQLLNDELLSVQNLPRDNTANTNELNAYIYQVLQVGLGCLLASLLVAEILGFVSRVLFRPLGFLRLAILWLSFVVMVFKVLIFFAEGNSINKDL